MLRNHITILFIIISLLGCNSRKAQEKNADKMLLNIQNLISQSAYNKAKNQIDSIHLLFPMLVEKRRIAAALSDTIIRRESSRTLIYCDSILPKKMKELDSIQKNFRFEKNSKYQDIGNYVYKTEVTESNAFRSYLKTYVDENADFYLISNYCGSRIDQQSVEVSQNDIFSHTDTISVSNQNNHSFDDGGSHFESLVFKNQSQRAVVEFIVQSSNKALKVSLHGKKTFSYYMSDTDKRAIIETYHFWKAKKDVVLLQTEIKKANARIKRIISNIKKTN